MKLLKILLVPILILSCKDHQPITESIGQKKEKIRSTKNRNVKPDGSLYSNEELKEMGHAEAMALLYEVPSDTVKTIGFLVYDGFFTMDAMGPLSVLNSMYPTQKNACR
ncbi:MAG: hypothetical protein AAGA43_15945 [Bacteroidota bacterium]